MRNAADPRTISVSFFKGNYMNGVLSNQFYCCDLKKSMLVICFAISQLHNNCNHFYYTVLDSRQKGSLFHLLLSLHFFQLHQSVLFYKHSICKLRWQRQVILWFSRFSVFFVNFFLRVLFLGTSILLYQLTSSGRNTLVF